MSRLIEQQVPKPTFRRQRPIWKNHAALYGAAISQIYKTPEASRLNSFFRWTTICAIATSSVASANAQDAEPRAYTNTPVGLNFLIAGYLYSQGKMAFDPSLSIADAKFQQHTGALAYVRSLEVGGKSAKFDVILPYSSFSADGRRGRSAQNARNVGPGRPAISLFDKLVRGSRPFSEGVCGLPAGSHRRSEYAGVGPVGAIRQQQIAQPR